MEEALESLVGDDGEGDLASGDSGRRNGEARGEVNGSGLVGDCDCDVRKKVSHEAIDGVLGARKLLTMLICDLTFSYRSLGSMGRVFVLVRGNKCLQRAML